MAASVLHETARVPGRLEALLVCAGVLMASGGREAGAPSGWEHLLRPAEGRLGERVPALVKWSDPTALLSSADLAKLYPEWWMLALEHDASVRLVVPDDADFELIDLLSRAAHVSAVTMVLEPPIARPVTAWSWPLRLAISPGWAVQGGGGPGDRDTLESPKLRSLVPWFDQVVERVSATGRWARASLALLGDLDGTPTGPSPTASAVVAFGDPTRPDGPQFARRLASRHGAALSAVVDAGSRAEPWLAELLIALVGGQPLDQALYTAARRSGVPLPLILGEPGFLDTTRFLDIVARRLPPSIVRGEAVLSQAVRGEAPAAGPGDRIVSDPSGAIVAARLLREDRRYRSSRATRVLRAEVWRGKVPVIWLEPATRYELRVWIGPPDPTASSTEPFPTWLLPGGQTYELTVLVVGRSGEYGGRVPVTSISLPSEGSSTRAVFTITTPEVSGEVDLRIVVLYGVRFLQSGVLRGVVGQPYEFTVDAVVRGDTESLDLASKHDMAVLVDAAGPEEDRLTVLHKGATPVSFSMRPAELREIVEAFDRLVDDPERTEGYGSDGYAELLIHLASIGHRLFGELFGKNGAVTSERAGELRAADRVSVLTTRAGDVVPLELVYDRDLRVNRALGRPGRICPRAPHSAHPDECATKCPDGGSADVVCPWGFWGIRKVIERHAIHDLSPGGEGMALAISPSVERHSVPIGSIIAAASDRADHNDARVWTAAQAELPPGTVLVSNWRDLFTTADRMHQAGDGPDVVALVVHNVRDEYRSWLEIGTDDRFPLTDSFAPLLVEHRRRNPIVLMLGCATARGAAPMFEAPAVLLGQGAPAVIATLNVVRARHLVPVAVRLLTELYDCAAQGGDSALVGETLRRARQRCLLLGHGVALGVIGFGDTDWAIDSRRYGDPV